MSAKIHIFSTIIIFEHNIIWSNIDNFYLLNALKSPLAAEKSKLTILKPVVSNLNRLGFFLFVAYRKLS